jgi:hypothetical protein
VSNVWYGAGFDSKDSRCKFALIVTEPGRALRVVRCGHVTLSIRAGRVALAGDWHGGWGGLAV